MNTVNTPSLRACLHEAFNDEEFTDFCFDYFPQVEKEFTDGLIFSRKIQLLLQFCRQREQWTRLLSLLETERAAVYMAYKEAITTPGAAGFVDDLDSYRSVDKPRLFVNVPQPRPHFVGREAVIEALVAQLTSEGQGQPVALATAGQGGVGKTAVAIALAWDKRVLNHFSDGVLWAGLGIQPDVLTLLAEWGRALGQDLSGLVEVEQRRRAVQQLIGQKRLLLVLDDVWQQAAAEALHCAGPFCRLLLTTRDNTIATRLAVAAGVAAVQPLAAEAALGLLQTLAPEAWAADAAAVQQLAAAVGGLPLALELLGGYLAAPERNAFPDLSQQAVAELHDPAQRLALAQKRLGSGQRQTLMEVVALSLEGLPETAVQAWLALGAFAPKPATFSRAAAQAVAQTDGGTLGLLLARHLLEKTEEGLVLHQVLADVARGMGEGGEERGARGEGRAAQTRHRDYYLALVDEDRKDWQRIEAAYGQIQWAWARLPERAVLAWVWAIGNYQRIRGLWREYIVWAERGLAVAQVAEQHQDEGTLLNNIGAVYDSLGERQKALDYYEQALPIREAVGDRRGVAQTLNNIGRVYDSLGERQKALNYYEQALPIREAVGDKAGTAVTLNNIGLVYDNMGEWQKALYIYEQTLPFMEAAGDRAGTAVTLNNIGLVYDNLGERQRALSYYEQALPIREALGDRAGESVTRYNIARIYQAEAQIAEAVAQMRRVVVLSEAVRSPYLERFSRELADMEAELANS